MMLAVSALNAATNIVANMCSPSTNACVKRVAPLRFRYDPYCARVIPAEFAMSPLVLHSIRTPMKMTEPMPVAKAPSGPRFAVVQFKHESITYLAPFRVTEGDIVVVEGDRGENIGRIATITQVKPNYDVPAKILRKATDADHKTLATQRQRELAAVKGTQALADSLGLHATIEDAEYQFDMNKLTIFVRRNAKNGFVDFRKLQRGLFREFRCRIWCAYMDEVEAADEAPRCR